MKTSELRFLGTGNYTLNDGGHQRRVWRVKCSKCDAEGIVGSSNRILPPDVILKKFRQKGWMIEKTDTRDLCEKCQKTIKLVAPPPPPRLAPLELSELEQPLEVRQKALIDTLHKKIRTLEQAFDQKELQLIRVETENSRLRAETADPLKFSDDCPNDFLRMIHNLLLVNEVTLARQKIEQKYPKWAWPQPAIKKTGSIKRRTKVTEDVGFDEWLNKLEARRVR